MPVNHDNNGSTGNAIGKLLLNAYDTVHVVKFSPFAWSSNLLAVGSHFKIVIYSCNLQKHQQGHQISHNGSSDDEEPQFKCLADIHLPAAVVDVAWSPDANINEVPQTLKLFAADSDHSVVCIESHVRHQSTVSSGALTTVGKHSDYVNAITAHPTDGLHVASVSDDLTCCVWTVENLEQGSGEVKKLSFPLTSPGMSVCWHPVDTSKILVGEKKGVIRLYNIETVEAVMSLDCMRTPLTSADWCPNNQLLISVLVQGEWLLFDTSKSQMAVERHSSHAGGGRTVLWCRSHEHLIATTGRPGVELKVFNIHTGQAILSLDMKVSYGLSWHGQQPILAVGVDNQVHFLTVDTHL